MPVDIHSLGYVGVESPRFAQWLPFTDEVLGAQASDHGGFVAVQLDSRVQRLIVSDGPFDRLAFIGLEVCDEDSLCRARELLVSSGFEVLEGTPVECHERGVARLVWFRDPAGTRYEIFFGALEKSAGYSGATPFRTGDLGMGHLVLIVPDLLAYTSFLQGCLGFKLTDQFQRPGSDDRGLFFRCNQRHHTVAIAQRAGWRGLHHVMVEAFAIDDVGAAYDRAARSDLVAMTLGRHVNDEMFSFYLRTPSGFLIEYGYGGRLISEPWSVRTHDESAVWGHTKQGEQPLALEELRPGTGGSR